MDVDLVDVEDEDSVQVAGSVEAEILIDRVRLRAWRSINLDENLTTEDGIEG